MQEASPDLVHPTSTSTNRHPRAAPPVLVCGLACAQRYLATKGLFADNEIPACLGAGSCRSSTGKSASRKRSRNESQYSVATNPRQNAADRAVAAAQAEDALALPRPKPRPAPGYYGVRAHTKRWAAKIRYGAKQHHSLGTFDTKQEAALAYNRETRQCGEEKPLNYKSMEGAEGTATKAQAGYAVCPRAWRLAHRREGPVQHRATTACVPIRSGGQQRSATAEGSTTALVLGTSPTPSRRPRSRIRQS
jgi:hypothetical protein